MAFGLLLGSPGDNFGGHLGARVSKWNVYVDIFGVFVGASKKSEKATQSRQKRSLFGGGRHGSSVVNSGPN